MSEKGYVTANDLQKWIDHLTEMEKDLPIVISEKMFPKPSEMLEILGMEHFISSSYDGFVMVVKKNFEAVIEEMFDDK